MEKYKICPGCGKHYTAKSLECRYCEISLAGIQTTDDETEATREKNKREEPVKGSSIPNDGHMIKICSECGAINAPNVRKCENCGEDISDVRPTLETDIQPVGACKFILQSISGDFNYEVPLEGCIVGRENQMSEYLMNKTFVSRQHATIYIENDRLFIENLSKTNNTYVNNVMIKEKTELKADDEIGLGGNNINGKRQDLAAYFIIRQE